MGLTEGTTTEHAVSILGNGRLISATETVPFAATNQTELRSARFPQFPWVSGNVAERTVP
jgi:hypothetical protein